MKILTIGDSCTWGDESSDPSTMSWPAQMAKKYNVQVTNLARKGCSNKRQIRICFEEIARNSDYDCIIFPLAPAFRTEILKMGKWHQIWPKALGHKSIDESIDKIFTEFWHPWNDIQQIILDCFSFINTIENYNIKLFITSLSLEPSKHYKNELRWIEDYKDDNDFARMGMPLSDFNIGINDLDRKLKSLRALHQRNLQSQPEYLYDVNIFLNNDDTKRKYGDNLFAPGGHPNDAGYTALSDYFAQKIGLTE